MGIIRLHVLNHYKYAIDKDTLYEVLRYQVSVYHDANVLKSSRDYTLIVAADK